MEKVLLEAEMLDLKANPNRKATGSIIESQLDKGRGYVSTVLVSNGASVLEMLLSQVSVMVRSKPCLMNVTNASRRLALLSRL